LQQAAEKYLKAMLAFHGVHFEKVHDLERLLAMCTQHDIALPDYAASFVELNPYAVEGRYDLIVDDTHDAERFCERIAAFREFCTTHILP
jgi:HEPN domain-containing protein